jgi:hypothetical protein
MNQHPMSEPGKPRDESESLGGLLTSRKGSLLMWVAAILSLCAGVFLELVGTSLIGDGYVVAGVIIALFGLAFLGCGLLATVHVRRRVDFHEFGAVVFQGSQARIALRYDACEHFRFVADRNHCEGLYLFTSLVITLKAADGRTVRWIGLHKERLHWDMQWRWNGMSRSKGIIGSDELDSVKLWIADAIADRWIERLLSGEKMQWGTLALAATHVTPTKGKRKGRPIAFEEIVRVSADDGRLALFHHADKTAFARIKLSSRNFWPGFRAFERLRHATEG